MTDDREFELLAICTAYEQGVGKGCDSRGCKNPYANDGTLNADCHWAWQHGYEEGERMKAKAGEYGNGVQAAVGGLTQTPLEN